MGSDFRKFDLNLNLNSYSRRSNHLKKDPSLESSLSNGIYRSIVQRETLLWYTSAILWETASTFDDINLKPHTPFLLIGSDGTNFRPSRKKLFFPLTNKSNLDFHNDLLLKEA